MGKENMVRGLEGEPKESSLLEAKGKLEFPGISSVRFYLKDQVGKNYEGFSYQLVSHR